MKKKLHISINFTKLNLFTKPKLNLKQIKYKKKKHKQSIQMWEGVLLQILKQVNEVDVKQKARTKYCIGSLMPLPRPGQVLGAYQALGSVAYQAQADTRC